MKDFIEFVLQYKVDFILCCIFVALDFLTGVSIALINRKYSSHKCRKGFEKIIGYLVLKICLVFFCYVMPQFKSVFHVYCYGIIFIEFTSILENVKPYLPEKIVNILNKFLENVKEGDSNG